MIRLFGFRIFTQKDINELNSKFNSINESLSKINLFLGQGIDRIDKNTGQLVSFEQKFKKSMEFIGRNLPLKRVRKKFRKITEW